MKIARIRKIKTHRVFRDFSWPSDLPAFARYNVIYGWNGSGKTTLSSLFSYIERRQPVTEGHFEIELDNQSVVSGTAFETATLPCIRVFNHAFVERTIAAIKNDNISPIAIFIGEKKVEDVKLLEDKKVELNKCAEKLSDISSSLSSEDNALSNFLTKGAKSVKDGLLQYNASQYANYNKQRFESTLRFIKNQHEQVVPLEESDLAKLQAKALQHPKGSVSFSPPTLPNLDSLREQVCKILGKSVVSKAIEELVRNPQLSEWVQTGLTLHSGEHHSDRCHFCGNPFLLERKEELEAHFNDAVKAIQKQIDSLLSAIVQYQARLSVARNQLPHPTQFYEELSTECDNICSQIIEGSLALHGRLQLYSEYLRKKRENLFEEQYCDVNKGDDDSILLPLQTAFNNLVSLVQRHLQKTDTLAADCNMAVQMLERHMVLGWLEEYNSRCSSIDAKLTEKSTLETTRKELTQTIKTLELSLVEKSKAAEELNDDLKTYLGRDEISFSVTEDEIGYRVLRNGQPAMNLSEGEQSAIAFLYFLRTLTDRNFDLGKGIVIIDDPVSSLDSTALFSAFSFMKSRIENCNQLIILTHNFVFLKNITTWFHYLQRQKGFKNDVKYYGLRACYSNGIRSSSIMPLDPLLNTFDSEYHYLFKRLYEFSITATAQQSLSALYEIPNIARRVLEVFLAYQWPTCQSMISAQLGDIEYDSVKKTRIGRLLNACSHGGGIQGPEHDPTALNEAKTAILDVMDMIKHFNPSHYNGMVELIHSSSSTQVQNSSGISSSTGVQCATIDSTQNPEP